MAVVSSIDSSANGMFFGLRIINKAKKWSGHGLTSLTGSSAPEVTCLSVPARHPNSLHVPVLIHETSMIHAELGYTMQELVNPCKEPINLPHEMRRNTTETCNMFQVLYE